MLKLFVIMKIPLCQSLKIDKVVNMANQGQPIRTNIPNGSNMQIKAISTSY